MPTEIETKLLTLGEWTFRLRPPVVMPAPVLLLLHGWTGDENSMWVFVRNMPASHWILAPRAPFTAPGKGYTWREIQPGSWGLPSIHDLEPAAVDVLRFLDDWGAEEKVDVSRMSLMGFSQGTALSYTIAMHHPERVVKLAGLAGFVPAGCEHLLTGKPFSGKKFYVAHGRQDELIPIARGREAAAILQAAGAQVIFCEADTGHRVSAGCFNGLDTYWKAD